MKYIPHELIEEDIKNIIEPVKKSKILTPSEKEKMRYIYPVLTGKYKQRWIEVKESFLIDEVEKFASDVKKIGESVCSELLIEWSSELIEKAQSFDMEKMPTLLDKYQEILKEFDSLLD